MIRGTTARFNFKLPCTKDDLFWVTVKFWQQGNSGTPEAPLPIKKTLAHCSTGSDSDEICVSLTALETMRFSDKTKAQVQFRAQRKDGTVFGNKTRYVPVYPMRDDILDDDAPIIPDSNTETLIIFDAGTVI